MRRTENSRARLTWAENRNYINLEEKAETVHIDSNTLKVLHHWPLAPGGTATALAFDPQSRRLFAGCRGGQLMVVLDADSGSNDHCAHRRACGRSCLRPRDETCVSVNRRRHHRGFPSGFR